MITTRERTLVACLLAVSNMGCCVDEHRLQDTIDSYMEGQTTDDLITIIAAPYLEDSNAEDAFEQEASSWFTIIGKYNWEQLFDTFSHHRHFRLIRNSDPSRQG